MKKLFKFGIVLVIAVIFAISTFAADSGSCGENAVYRYDKDTGVLTISGQGAMSDFDDYTTPWNNYSDGIYGISSIKIENGITRIGDYAFCELTYLDNCVEIEIPDTVTSIGDWAFYGTFIQELYIPSSVSYISETAFFAERMSPYVESIVVAEENPFYFCDSDGVLYNRDKSLLLFHPKNDKTKYSIPYGVERIGEGAFSCCSSLINIYIPDSVKNIGSAAFMGCYSLREISIPDSVKKIEDYCFYFDHDLTDIVINDSVTEIGEHAFDYTNINNVVLPATITNIGERAFEPMSDDLIFSQTVYGFKDSKAHEYAKSSLIKFVDLETLSKDDEINLFIGMKKAIVFGELIDNDVTPILVNDRTMLPARFVSENIGANVMWNEELREVTILKNDTEIKIYVGSDTAFVNGEPETLDSPAFVRNNRTYTPVRFICEALGTEVDWDETTHRVIIKSPK